MSTTGFDYRAVKRTRPIRPIKPVQAVSAPRPAQYLGGWIRALGATPAEVSRKTGINEGYLSELINGGKKNPAYAKLKAIADFLKIEVGRFDEPPPPQDFVRKLRELGPLAGRIAAADKDTH